MSINEVTVHLDMLGRTEAGTVFGNIDEKVIVLRWQSLSEATAAVKAVEMLDAEFAGSGADTLIYDTRRVAMDEGSALDAMLRTRAIEHGHARRVGWIVANSHVPLPVAVEDLLDAHSIESCIGTSFEDVAKQLVAMPGNLGNLLSEGIANFSATYAGSCYSIPELRTTVLRSAGNFYDLSLAGQLYKRSFDLHTASGAIGFIVDTSAIAPIHSMERYSFSFEALILPLCVPGMVQQLVHVRAGDPLFPTGAAHLQQLSRALEAIDFAETESTREALDIIRSTQGRKLPTPNTNTGGIVAFGR